MIKRFGTFSGLVGKGEVLTNQQGLFYLHVVLGKCAVIDGNSVLHNLLVAKRVEQELQ